MFTPISWYENRVNAQHSKELGVGTITSMPKIMAASLHIQETEVLEVGRLYSIYRHIFVIGGDNTGFLCFSITRYSANQYAVYGNRNGLKVYYDANGVVYIQSASGHLARPIAWNIGDNPQDTITMIKRTSLPSGVTECSYQE